mmetsp:Transcript_27843/g.81518  ORF Transcript_27843/g.81518 Transcript_27843/m.81518 type:complete len:280 (-) Transcript_27843:832-1671(-)|eukprot:CAMPEP_0118984454 /NCGR_PEP_ID=MMETSP1173-20130426/37802_1 /TAXON_ID=1034831 /ORGANISM="Rhizochromulina marina cf, Strain CCMP1243" /LENGTH=279 /DNA_ID=CAMNT_0006935117 /DNA_START=125 /DNA_END=964 /DNA_ORIENTATION=-
MVAAPANEPLAQLRSVIIFDWDDTLMSSSWAERAKLLPIASFESLPVDLQSEFRLLEERVAKCLSRALELGAVVVITNAEQGWVEYSSQRFMPRLVPLLNQLRVVSARSTYERFFPNAPLCWKAAAFAHEAKTMFAGMDGSSTEDEHKGAQTITGPRQILSIGDSNEERTAVQIAARQLGATAKSVKLVDLPTLGQLSKQVEAVTGWLEWLCGHKSELDLMLKATPTLSGTSAPDLKGDGASRADVDTPMRDASPATATSANNADHPWRPPTLTSLNVA